METLTLLICIKTTAIACENASVAYYKQSQIEKVITDNSNKYSAKYPLTAALLAQTAAIYQGKIILNMGSGKYFSVESKKSMIGFKSDF